MSFYLKKKYICDNKKKYMSLEILLIITFAFFIFFIIMSLYSKKCKKSNNRKKTPKTCNLKCEENFDSKENFMTYSIKKYVNF